MADIITARIDFYPCNGGLFEGCDAEFRVETERADPGGGDHPPDCRGPLSPGADRRIRNHPRNPCCHAV